MKRRNFRLSFSPDNAAVLAKLRWENKVPFDCLLFSNISAKNYPNRSMFFKVIASQSSVFFETQCK